MTTFGFVGTGHMGCMLVKKFVETGAIGAEEIMASNRTQEKEGRLADNLRHPPGRIIVLWQSFPT